MIRKFISIATLLLVLVACSHKEVSIAGKEVQFGSSFSGLQNVIAYKTAEPELSGSWIRLSQASSFYLDKGQKRKFAIVPKGDSKFIDESNTFIFGTYIGTGEKDTVHFSNPNFKMEKNSYKPYGVTALALISEKLQSNSFSSLRSFASSLAQSIGSSSLTEAIKLITNDTVQAAASNVKSKDIEDALATASGGSSYGSSPSSLNWSTLSASWKKLLASNVDEITGTETSLLYSQRQAISNLTKLDINKCTTGCSDIATLDPIKHMTNLTDLILKSVKINNVTTAHFSKLTKLAYLDLSGNKITNIPPGTFTSLNNLYYLDLSQQKNEDGSNYTWSSDKQTAIREQVKEKPSNIPTALGKTDSEIFFGTGSSKGTAVKGTRS